MEMATTRKTLERVPEDKTTGNRTTHPWPWAAWPGTSLRWLGFAAADLSTAIRSTSRPRAATPMQPTVMTSRKQLLEIFDKNVAAAREAISKASDEDLHKTWTLMNGGKTFFAMPRIAVLRGMILNHVIHHRGQLSVYLRMNQVPVPSIYGPSGDEGRM